jgi:DNA primase
VCADGDEPGLAAAEKWVRTLMAHGQETVVTVLPDGHDPASWLRHHGVAGLCALTRKGCLDLLADTVKPTPAGGLLAERILTEQVAAARRHNPDAEPVMALPAVLRQLAAEAVMVPGDAAVHRFATAAGDALARLVDGMDAAGRARQVLAAVHHYSRAAAVTGPREINRWVTR